MDVAPAKAQGSVNPEAGGFMLTLVPFSRYLCAQSDAAAVVRICLN